VVAGDNEYVPEETPEQVEARLARYADTLRRARGAPLDDAARRNVSQAVSGVGTLPPRSALQSVARRPQAAPAASAASAYPSSPGRPPVGVPTAMADPLAAPPQHLQVSAAAPRHWPEPAERRFVFSRPLFADVRLTMLGHWVAAAGAAGAVLAFIALSTMLASVLVLALFGVGVAAIAGHRSLAWWWTIGVLVGGLLGRFS